MRFHCNGFILRPFTVDDAASVARHANNPKVAANLRDQFPHPYTLRDARAFLKAAAGGTETIFAIEVNGEAVGAIGLIPGTDIERCAAEIGYWLGEAYWGRGIATEAIRTITEGALPHFELTRIFAKPFVENIGSIRALEKCGYVREGRLCRAAVKNGEIRDFYIYARVR
jgi:ribosomal-protein-alanine N-acetyltransferase